jgi:hypothetical protein
MSTTISRKFFWDVIKDRPASVEGGSLAKALLSKDDVDWNDLTVDMRGMSYDLLNVSFFWGFLQQVADDRSEILESARKVKWLLSHRGLDDMVAIYVTKFLPRDQRKPF